jgi:hypothetical protein
MSRIREGALPAIGPIAGCPPVATWTHSVFERDIRRSAEHAGAAGTACAMFDAKSPHIPTLVDYVRTAWSVASDSMRSLRPMGPAYLGLRIEHGAGTVDAGDLTRGPIGFAVADDLLPGIERELMRLSHRFAFEDV